MRQPLTERERAEALSQFSKDTGIIISDKQQGLDTLTKYLAEIVPPDVLQLAQDRVDVFFSFSMVESGVDSDGRGGGVENTETGRIVYLIGVAKEAVDRGRDYSVMVWLHELSHLITGEYGHSVPFHDYTNYLLLKVKEYSGVTIKNDYYGLPADQRPPDARQRP